MGVERYQIKCSTVRAYAEVLARQLPAICERLTPAARETMLNLPLPSTWIDGEILDSVLEEVHRRDGEAGLKKVIDEALRQSLVPGLIGVVQTVFRIVGTSPAFLLERLNAITRNHLRGVEFEYRGGDQRSGEMTVRLASKKSLRPVWLLVHRLNLLSVFRVCNENGTVEAAVVSADGASALYRMRW